MAYENRFHKVYPKCPEHKTDLQLMYHNIKTSDGDIYSGNLEYCKACKTYFCFGQKAGKLENAALKFIQVYDANYKLSDITEIFEFQENDNIRLVYPIKKISS